MKTKIWKLWRIATAVMAGYMILLYLAALLPDERLIGNKCLPDSLKGKSHNDYYLPGTRWIPRSVTSWCMEEPPIQLLGNQKRQAHAQDGTTGPKPIPEAGEWQVSAVQMKKGWPLFLPYVAITTKSGRHFRIGCRWDDVDHYYTFPSIAIAKVRLSEF